MTPIFQCLFSCLLGIALAIYGLLHSVSTYPGEDTFARLATDLPSLAAVLVFVLCVLAATAGAIVLVLSLRRLRLRWRHLRQLTASRRHYDPLGPGGGSYADDGRDWQSGAYR